MGLDWLTDIIAGCDDWAARLTTAEGDVEIVPLSELHRRGTPELQANIKRRVEVDFADFKSVDATPVLAQLGILLPDGLQNKHAAYEIQINGEAFVMPALALMRELFSPSTYLLPDMFRPQALDLVSRLKYDGEEADVVVDAVWVDLARQKGVRDCTSTIAWMHACESARKMAGSVHRAAIEGRIDLALPVGKLKMALECLPVGGKVLVTALRIASISTNECPDFPIRNWSDCVLIRGRQNHGGNAADSIRLPCPVHAHADGGTDVTDQEWSRIEPILEATKAQLHRPGHLDQRLLLNGILRKLRSKCAWRKSPYEVGTWVNAAQTFRDWSRRGAFEQILEVLRDFRACDHAREQGRH